MRPATHGSTKAVCCLIFGPPGAGKSHLASAIGLALVESGYRVLFTRTTDLVQRLQVARRDLTLENLLAKLDRYHLVILDDFAYVRKDQAETSVLFELISVRYERRSLLITANQPFGEWHKVFPDETTAVAVQVDRCEPAGEPCKGPQGPGAEYAGSEGERKYSAGENTAEAEIEKRGRGSGLVRRRPDGIGNGHRTSDIGSRCRIAVYG